MPATRTTLGRRYATDRRGRGWLASDTKATGKPRVPSAGAVEEALRFGWIDSRPLR
jgi:hypothetical protein